jgi:hypothetical protein
MPSTALAIAKKKLTDEEQQMITAMTKPGAVIDVVVPAEIDPKQWKSNTSLVCRVLIRAQMQEQVMMPVLGRLLVIAKNTPTIIEGHESFEAFLKSEIYEKYGVSRTTCFESIQMCRWEGLTISQFEAIGRRNFRLLNQAVPKGDEKEKWAKALLAKASELTEEELEEYCEEKGYFAKGEAQGAHFKFACNKRQLKDAKKWYDDPRVHAAVGSESPADIHDAMIAECSAEWFNRGQKILDERKAAEEADEKRTADAEEAEGVEA